jgi:phage-related protein
MRIIAPWSTSKPIRWIGSSRKALREAPEDVRRVMGVALRFAQLGDRHPDAKPLRGYGGSRVFEIVADDNRRTYRGVYTVEFEGVVFVLHVFQKKSTTGIKTKRGDLDVIDGRRRDAREIYERNLREFQRLEAQRRQSVRELRRVTGDQGSSSTRKR